MITQNDFHKKQIIFVFSNEGEKISLSNENLIVKDKEGNIKLQCSCYRLFIVYIVGACSLTTPLIKKASQFGFYFALMTGGYHLYSVIGANKDANTLLKRKQYSYSGTDLAKAITQNKIRNQAAVLNKVRYKNDIIKDAILSLEKYHNSVNEADSIQSVMAYEGLSSKAYFKAHFNNVLWQGRQPRVKKDYVNSVLDIGYTLLFSFVDAILSSFGFDNYCGVMHTQFYMRKSLVCDIVEPFRPIIDDAVKKGINLKQIKPDDFSLIKGQYQLKWKKSPEYAKLMMSSLLKYKDEIFIYIRDYYRAFMKNLPVADFPAFSLEEEK